jgi:hypothetical protein
LYFHLFHQHQQQLNTPYQKLLPMLMLITLQPHRHLRHQFDRYHRRRRQQQPNS